MVIQGEKIGKQGEKIGKTSRTIQGEKIGKTSRTIQGEKIGEGLFALRGGMKNILLPLGILASSIHGAKRTCAFPF